MVQPGPGGSGSVPVADAGRNLGQRLVALSPESRRPCGSQCRSHSRCEAAEGAIHAGHAARWPESDARRSTPDVTSDDHRRGRPGARSRCRRPELQRPALPVQQLERRRCRTTHDRHAGERPHVHRDVHRRGSGHQPAARGFTDAPAGGSTGVVGAPITLDATATDDESIASVQFFDGTTAIGTDTTAPFSVNWTPSVTGVTRSPRAPPTTPARPPPAHRYR